MLIVNKSFHFIIKEWVSIEVRLEKPRALVVRLTYVCGLWVIVSSETKLHAAEIESSALPPQITVRSAALRVWLLRT